MQMNGSKGVQRRAGIYGCLILLSGWCLCPARAQEAALQQTQQNNVTIRRTVEDFDVPKVNRSQLQMEPPTPGEIDRLEKYTRERWQVQWRNLDPIDLYIITPAGVKNPPVILYLYSEETASKQPFINDGWCQRVTRGGFAAVGFVPALTEDRFEKEMRPMKQWFVSELEEALGITTHDVQMVLDYLELRKDIDVSRVGILGIGSGATVGILAAAADPRIKVLDLMNPWGDWPDWLAGTPLILPMERKEFVTPEFLAKVAPLDPVKWLPTLTSQDVRIQIVEETMGEREEIVAATRKLESVAPKNVQIAHFATQDQIKSSIYRTGGSFQWVKDQLESKALLAPVSSMEQDSTQPEGAKKP